MPGGDARAAHAIAVSDRILQGAVAFAVTAVAVQTAVDLVVHWAFDHDVWVLLADSDESVFAWASIVTTFAAALGALLLSLAGRDGRALLWFVAAAVAFLSLDDFVQIHERLGERAGGNDADDGWEPGRLVWPAIFFPLLAALFLALRRVAARLGGRAGFLVLVALALFAAAILLELASAGIVRAGYDAGTTVYELEVVAEEGAELAGWVLVTGAFLAALVRELGAPRAGLTRD
ncbi:MAG TPA: hypothetical protein VD704_08830 [Gaiellaceae bacterium]|nr:hypothetical protein [Gaiellaceae bacterium]